VYAAQPVSLTPDFTMFNPSQEDVRRFFCDVYRKQRSGEAMEAIEVLSGQWIDEHPEFHAELSDVDAALRNMRQPDATKNQPIPAPVDAPEHQRAMLH
jgi:hypothetical protein